MQKIFKQYEKTAQIIFDGVTELLLISLVSLAVTFVGMFAMFFVGIFFPFVMALFDQGAVNLDEPLAMVLGIVAGLLALLIIIAFILLTSLAMASVQAALVYAIHDIAKKHKVKTVKEYLKMGYEQKWNLFGLMILQSLLITLGFIFFIIPGIILSILFALPIYALLLEKKSIRESLKRSVKLVKVNFWPFTGRMLLLMLVMGLAGGAVGFIPFGNIFVQIFAMIISVAYYYVLYQDMSSNKKPTDY